MLSFEDFISEFADKVLVFVIPGAVVEGKISPPIDPKKKVLYLSDVIIYSGIRKAHLDHLALRIDQISAWSNDTFAPEPVNFFFE